jgi:hypothetical protein
VLRSRSTTAQWREYFLAGVGLETGHKVDEQAVVLNRLLHDADLAVLQGEEDLAVSAITAFASIVLEIHPFAPKKLPARWEAILSGWLWGLPAAEFTTSEDADA